MQSLRSHLAPRVETAGSADQFDDDLFILQFAVCWPRFANEVQRCQALGDSTASLRALLLAAAVVEGDLEPDQAYALFTRRKRRQ